VKSRVVAALVNYNSGEETTAAVSSLRALKNDADLDIVVVDNCSSDGSGERLRDSLSASVTEVLLLDCNRGFAAGM